MLIDLIRNDNTLQHYLKAVCEENGIAIEVDPSIAVADMIVIKVDDFYNSEVSRPDKSPDCLVIQRCSENRYNLYLIELRNIKRSKGFSVSEILEKFITCLDDFMSQRYGNYFHDPSFDYIKIHLVFISDPYGFRIKPEKQLFMRGHKLDALMAQHIPKFFNKHLYIEHKVPNPTIRNCR